MQAQTTLGLEYSAFFSSGLLAQQHTPQKKVDCLIYDYSPSRPSSPISIPNESLMDIDLASGDDRRSTTPTPQTITPMQSPQPVKIQSKSQAQSTPRLRKRRSSLTLAASSINAIRSPSRSASNALHLQCQLALSPRSRSGSASGEDLSVPRYSNVGVANTESSLGGRMKDGNLGSAPPSSVPVKRRPTRRLRISPLQAPLAPPPTIPLPALPSTEPNQQLFRLTNVNAPPARTAHTKASSHSASSTSATSARARGLSVSSSTLDGDANRIDEDMKEN